MIQFLDSGSYTSTINSMQGLMAMSSEDQVDHPKSKFFSFSFTSELSTEKGCHFRLALLPDHNRFRHQEASAHVIQNLLISIYSAELAD
jgi:hypothetical protein